MLNATERPTAKNKFQQPFSGDITYPCCLQRGGYWYSLAPSHEGGKCAAEGGS